jgi:hypothetical protein
VPKLTLYFNKVTQERQPQHHSATVVQLAKQPFQQDQNGKSMPCATLTPPEFSFEFTGKGAAHNLEVLRKYNLNLGKALKAQQDSPLGNGKKFNLPSVLQQVFGLHPLWN